MKTPLENSPIPTATDTPQPASQLVPIPDPVKIGEKQGEGSKATQFKPGQSGNPNGRPVGKKNFTTKVREAMERVADGQATTYEELIVKRIMLKAAQGDVNLIKHMWDQFDGRPTQKVTLKGAVAHTELAPDKLQEVMDRIDAELEAVLTEAPDDSN